MIKTRVVFTLENETKGKNALYKHFQRWEIESPDVTFWQAMHDVYMSSEEIPYFERTKEYVNSKGEKVFILQKHSLGTGLYVSVSIYGDSPLPRLHYSKDFSRYDIIKICRSIYGDSMNALREKRW